MKVGGFSLEFFRSSVLFFSFFSGIQVYLNHLIQVISEASEGLLINWKARGGKFEFSDVLLNVLLLGVDLKISHNNFGDILSVLFWIEMELPFFRPSKLVWIIASISSISFLIAISSLDYKALFSLIAVIYRTLISTRDWFTIFTICFLISSKSFSNLSMVRASYLSLILSILALYLSNSSFFL